jgi:predicted transcriptional regulator
MLQVMDLARENAALRRELERVREEAKALRLLVSPDEASSDHIEGHSATKAMRGSWAGAR